MLVGAIILALEIFGRILEDIGNTFVHLGSLRTVHESVVESNIQIHHLSNFHFAVDSNRTVHRSAHDNSRHRSCEVRDWTEGVIVAFHRSHVREQNCSEMVLLKFQEWERDLKVVRNKADNLSQNLNKQTR